MARHRLTDLCAKCKEKPRIVYATGRVFSYCQDCRDNYHTRWWAIPENKVLERARKRKWRAENLELARSTNLKWWRKNNPRHKATCKNFKQIIMGWYGGSCVCCDENHLTFLTLDHINDDGYKEKTKGNRRILSKTFYKLLVKRGLENLRKDLQILCCNCQMGKKNNSGFCPHHPEIDLRIVKNLDDSSSGLEGSKIGNSLVSGSSCAKDSLEIEENAAQVPIEMPVSTYTVKAAMTVQ